VQNRINNWLDPFATYDQLGGGYQIVQALIAHANGGWWGTGLGLGNASVIPEFRTDFIFSALINEFGMIFAILVLCVYAFIALRGAARVNLFDHAPSVAASKLFRRDRMTCAYCSQCFPERDLQCEHIVPESRGGGWTWMNLVTACAACNGRKAARTPEEARMPLVYLPYVPSRFEGFLLEGRHIRADVHEWLAARLPKGSRLS
jgi:hypothetical protein